MMTRTNHRGFKEKYKMGEHLTLDALRGVAPREDTRIWYLFREDVPAYPRPEFHVIRLKHDTGPVGLSGIIEDGGFKNPLGGPFLWWGLAVGPKRMASAERRLLETTYLNRSEEQKKKQESFLDKFAISPAFMSSSRLGSFRFILSLKEVLEEYKKQFCDGDEPDMRVMETVLYKQEVMYVVLVHSPTNKEQFSQYPKLKELPDEPKPVCTYNREKGFFTWRSEAMCGTHKFELVENDDEKQMKAERRGNVWYVWDNVALALHVNEKVLTFEREQLKKNLKFCKKGKPISIPKEDAKSSKKIRKYFVEFEEAQEIVREKFGDPQYKLKRADEKEEEEEALTSGMSKLKVSQ